MISSQAACRPAAQRLAGPPPLPPPRPARGLLLLPPRLGSARRVAARDRKLTGQSTETISHEDNSGGGSYSNRHGGGGGGGGGGGDRSDGGNGEWPEEPHHRRLLLLATLKWLAAGALVAAALLAALPAMLSHPAGLGLVLAVVNLASPLALTVHLDAAQLGWQQPLLLRGLRLVERGGGSGEGDYSSSDDEEHEPLPAVTQPSTTGSSSSSSSSSGSGGQSGGRLRGLRRRGAAAAPAADAAQAAAALDAAAAHGNGRRRRTLVSVERISTTRTLWQLLRGGGAVDCVVAKPQIDCTLNASGKPRLLAALQQAKVVPEAHPAPAQQAAGAAAVAALAAPSTTALAGQPAGQNGAQGGSGGKSGSGSKETQPGRPAGASSAAAAAAAGPSRRRQQHDDSSDSEAEEAALPVRRVAGQRGSAADGQQVSPAALLGYMMPAQGLKRSAKPPEPRRAQREAQPPAQQADGAGGAAAGSSGSAAGGSSGGRSWLPESLQVASSAVKVTGEVNTGKMSLCISDGALLVPVEARELLGKHLHFEVLRGSAAIEEAAANEQPAAGAPSGGSAGAAGSAGSAGSASKRPAAAKWVRQRPAVLLPWGTGMPQTPVQLRLDGELMQFSLQGWQTTKGFTYLRRPVEARMRFTPALSKYLLTHLHPLLGGTVGMKGATVVQARLIPHDGLLPTSQATVRIEPLSVEIGESPVLRSTVGVLGEVVKKLKLSAGARAELSPLQATLGSDGRLTAERLDVRIKTGLGPWSQGLHLVSWGSASLKPPQSLDATLAVPGHALASLGLPALPEGTGLPLHIGGTPDKPEVEIGWASRQLALLVVKQQAAKLGGGKGGAIQFLVDQVQQIGGSPEEVGVPLPPPLPPTVQPTAR